MLSSGSFSGVCCFLKWSSRSRFHLASGSRFTNARIRSTILREICSSQHNFAPNKDAESGSSAESPQILQPDNEGAPSSAFPGVRVHADGNFVAVYTCKICETRSARLISKRAYSHGIVLLRCPGCDNHHLLADNIGMFGGPVSAQQLLEAHGEAVRRGVVQAGADQQVIGLEPQDIEALRTAAANAAKGTKSS